MGGLGNLPLKRLQKQRDDLIDRYERLGPDSRLYDQQRDELLEAIEEVERQIRELDPPRRRLRLRFLIWMILRLVRRRWQSGVSGMWSRCLIFRLMCMRCRVSLVGSGERTRSVNHHRMNPLPL